MFDQLVRMIEWIHKRHDDVFDIAKTVRACTHLDALWFVHTENQSTIVTQNRYYALCYQFLFALRMRWSDRSFKFLLISLVNYRNAVLIKRYETDASQLTMRCTVETSVKIMSNRTVISWPNGLKYDRRLVHNIRTIKNSRHRRRRWIVLF